MMTALVNLKVLFDSEAAIALITFKVEFIAVSCLKLIKLKIVH